MARVTAHFHGTPKEKAYRELIDMYAQRLKKSGVRIEYHSNKLSSREYLARLKLLKGAVIYLDEGGVLNDSIEFSKSVGQWNVDVHDTHLAVGPAEGWPKDADIEPSSKLSLSPLTFPHELASTILVEQLYRATEILKGSGYHKA